VRGPEMGGAFFRSGVRRSECDGTSGGSGRPAFAVRRTRRTINRSALGTRWRSVRSSGDVRAGDAFFVRDATTVVAGCAGQRSGSHGRPREWPCRRSGWENVTDRCARRRSGSVSACRLVLWPLFGVVRRRATVSRRAFGVRRTSRLVGQPQSGVRGIRVRGQTTRAK
jgi:hypothetical protein